MRTIMLGVVAALAAAGCGEQAKAPVEPATTPAVVARSEPAPGVVNVPPADVAARLAGRWQAIDDARAIVTIAADGTWTSDYVGEDTAHDVAAWRAFSGAQAPRELADHTFTPTSTYIEVASADGKSYYELGDVDVGTFDMFYVGRGNRLAYTRVN